jgi:hypothetical protein
MACKRTLGDVSLTYDCNTAFGGLERVVFAQHPSTIDGEDLVVFEIEFNTHDGYTNFSETKTADLTGISQCIQTLQLEIPRMGVMSKTQHFSNPNMRFYVIMVTKGGKYIVMGYEFGAQVKSDNAQSGASRGEKSMIQLEIVAEEVGLAIVDNYDESLPDQRSLVERVYNLKQKSA